MFFPAVLKNFLNLKVCLVGNGSIDIKYRYIRDKIVKKELILDYCPTEEMLADLLTKPLGKTMF